MAPSERVLFCSNGHGEDRISLEIIHRFKEKNARANIYVLPLVGSGQIFSETDCINVVGPNRETKTGGFLTGLAAIISDLREGVLALHFRQIRNARKINVDTVVCVGDFFPFILAFLFLPPKKIIMVSTAKSDLFERHYFVEKWFFKRSKTKVFVRDEVTALNLRADGVDAHYVGNVMMDMVASPQLKPSQNFKNGVKLGILPGSRQEAYANWIKIKEVLRHLPKQWTLHIATPPQLEMSKFDVVGIAQSMEWVSFQGLTKTVDAVIGLAGTANEQCIGCGIPVFCFVGTGPQTTRKRFLDQHNLLKGLSEFVESQDSAIIAKHILKRMGQTDFINQIRKAGPQVMGKPGGASAIAESI